MARRREVALGVHSLTARPGEDAYRPRGTHSLGPGQVRSLPLVSVALECHQPAAERTAVTAEDSEPKPAMVAPAHRPRGPPVRFL